MIARGYDGLRRGWHHRAAADAGNGLMSKRSTPTSNPPLAALPAIVDAHGTVNSAPTTEGSAVEHTERVAIITVHGVADQQPGQTVGELARLLCHGGSDQARYVEGEKHEIIVPVRKLRVSRSRQAPRTTANPKTTRASDAGTTGSPRNFFLAHRRATRERGTPDEEDLGVTLTDYLLSRYEPGRARRAVRIDAHLAVAEEGRLAGRPLRNVLGRLLAFETGRHSCAVGELPALLPPEHTGARRGGPGRARDGRRPRVTRAAVAARRVGPGCSRVPRH